MTALLSGGVKPTSIPRREGQPPPLSLANFLLCWYLSPPTPSQQCLLTGPFPAVAKRARSFPICKKKKNFQLLFLPLQTTIALFLLLEANFLNMSHTAFVFLTTCLVHNSLKFTALLKHLSRTAVLPFWGAFNTLWKSGGSIDHLIRTKNVIF